MTQAEKNEYEKARWVALPDDIKKMIYAKRNVKRREYYHENEEYRLKKIEKAKALIMEKRRTDPEYRARKQAYQRRYANERYHNDPEYRAKQIEYSKRYYYKKKGMAV